MPAAGNLDWLYHVIGWTLAAAAVLLLLWAMYWDRSRGRRQCPKCWYDMGATSGMRCPECGREARREHAFFRTRRRWKLSVPALALLLAAHVAWSVPGVRRNGWAYLIPGPVLATVWPLDIKVWVESVHTNLRWPGADPVLDEWLRRCDEGELSSWSATRWAHRVKRFLRRTEPGRGCDLVSIGDLVRIQQSFAAPYRDRHGELLSSFFTRAEAASAIATVARDCIDPAGWAMNGGDRGQLIDLGPWLIVHSSPEAVQGVKDLVSAIRSASGTNPCPATPDWERIERLSLLLEQPVTGLTRDTTVLDAIERVHAATGVKTTINEGDLNRNIVVFDTVLKIASEGDSARQVLDACVRQVNDTFPGPRCEWLFEKDGVLITNLLEARWEYRGLATRVYHIADVLTPSATGNEREEALDELIGVLRDSIEPEGWVENGGDQARVCHIADRLIIWARPSVHLVIEDVLTQIREHSKR